MDRVRSVLLALLLATTAQATTLTVATDENFPPLTFVENGKAAGIDIDMMTEAARRIGLDVRFEPMPWRRTLLALQRGEVPMGMPLFKTPERNTYATFVAPVHYSDLGLFVAKGRSFAFNSLADLKGRHIGVMRGWSITDAFDTEMAEGQLDAEEASTMDQNLHKLLLGRIDAFASNVLSVRYVIKGTPMAQETELLPHLLQANRPAYVVVSRNVSLPDRDRLIDRLAKALAALQADGTYKRIVAHYEE